MANIDQSQLVEAIADGMGKMQATIARTALSDRAFRDRVTANPRAAVAEVVGQDLPPGLVVHVHENSSTVLHVVLPPVTTQGGVLNDEELEAVAAGVSPAVIVWTLGTVFTAIAASARYA